MWLLCLSLSLTRCSRRFTALGGSEPGTERPRQRPLCPRPSSGPALPAPPLRAGQRSRWGPAGSRRPSAPGPAGRAGQRRARAFGAAAAGQRCPGPGAALGGGGTAGTGGSPGGQCGAGGLSGPGQSPPARADPGSPTEAPAGPGRRERGGPGSGLPGPPLPALPSVPGHSLPSSAAPIEMREVLRFLPAKNKEAAAFIKAGPDEYGSDKFV